MASDSLAINLVRFTANIIMKNWSTIPFEHLYNIAFYGGGVPDGNFLEPRGLNDAHLFSLQFILKLRPVHLKTLVLIVPYAT